MNDVIVDPIRKVREALIQRFGGIDGYFKHCQALERRGAARRKPKRSKQPARTVRKTGKAR